MPAPHQRRRVQEGDFLFESIEDVREKLAGQKYVSDKRLATVVFLATRLNKPVLVEGPAGVGKTELAKSLAGAAGSELIRLQCYEGLDEAKFLYDYQVSIPEIGTIAAKHRPIVILTSNRTRELSEALKRRCLHLQLDYPSEEAELEIVRLKAPEMDEELLEE